MLDRRRQNRDHHIGPLQPAGLDSLHLGLGVRVFGAELGMDDLAVKTFARVAADHHQLPWLKRAMIGDPDSGCQDGFQMVRINGADRHGFCGNRAAGGKK